jgi:tetratricopeptide (TPR) repeat protein
MSPRFVLLVLALAPVLAAPSPVSAAKIWEREWREIRTQHFVIASALPEDQSAALATELENFRFVAQRLILPGAVGAFEERIPTKVYMLPSPERGLGLDGRIAGYFRADMRANYAVMLASGDASDEVLKHEYTHFLMHNLNAQLYPKWYNEGFADVLSTLTVTNGVIEYGKPMTWRIPSLTWESWMSVPQVLECCAHSPNVDMSLFEAQSWLLVHYLMIGRDGHKFSSEAADFLRRSEGGTPQIEAFEAAFGVDSHDLQRTLVTYTRNMRYFRSQGGVSLPPVDLQVRRMAVNEVAANLGLLALIHGNYKESEGYYAAALEANPNNGVALAGMGDIHKHAKRFDEAERHYALAVAAEPANANHELDWGEYFLQRADDEPDAEKRRALLVEARRHFARSYAVNALNPETLDQNGKTYLVDGEDPMKAVASLEAAHDLLPSQTSIQRHLAAAYVKTGQREPARVLLNRLLTWSHSADDDDIKKLLAELGPTEAPPASGQPAEGARSTEP